MDRDDGSKNVAIIGNVIFLTIPTFEAVRDKVLLRYTKMSSL